MALFKTKDNPPADPPAPEPGDGAGDPPAPQYMTMEQFNEQIKPLQETLSTVNESLKALNRQPAYQPPTAPVAPAEDPHKTQRERIAQIDKELGELADKSEDATYQGKGMAALMKRQNQLYQERSEVRGQMIAGQHDPRIDAGIQTIDALSTEVTLSKMPYLALPEVKQVYETYINQLAPAQRMNPQSKIGCYNLAVGQNLAVIQEADKQKWLRESQEPPTQDQPPGSPSGRQQPSKPGEITPEVAFSPEALRSIKTSRHRTAENYVRSLGYEGWEDYVEKNKDYLIEQEEGA